MHYTHQPSMETITISPEAFKDLKRSFNNSSWLFKAEQDCIVVRHKLIPTNADRIRLRSILQSTSDPKAGRLCQIMRAYDRIKISPLRH